MRRVNAPMLVTLAVALIVLVALALGGPPVAEVPARVSAASGEGAERAEVAVARPIVVEARVVPARVSELSAPLTGIVVAEVFVDEGDTVAQGEPLLRLDTRGLLLEVAEARAALSRTQANYDRLSAGATSAEIAAAQAELAEAQAQLQQAQGRVTSADVAAASANLEQARARLRELEAGPQPAAVSRERASVEQTRGALEQARAQLSAAKEEARRLMEERANDLRAAQVTLGRAREERQRNSGDDAAGRLAADALARAELELANAESALERARVEYEARRQDEIAGLAEAEARVAEAQATLDMLVGGSRPGELASARAQVVAAEAELARLGGGQRDGEVSAAVAAVAQAQARLDGLTIGPLEADLAQALATIEESEVRLRQAELRLEQATLTAPIAGTVAAIEVTPGELPEGREVIVTLADTSAWWVEARALTDLEVVRVRAGDPVTISAYAVPGLSVAGRVARIEQIGRGEGDQARYTALIEPEGWDARLRWNMLTQVTIQTGRDGMAGE
jgi:multidrug resistance efflux pump